MTDLRESMSRLLEGEPAVPMIADQVVASGRRTQRRRRGAAAAAVIAGVAVIAVGAMVVAPSVHNGRGVAQIVPADSATPTPSDEPTPMATSTIGTPSGDIQTLVPKCPVGQLPNLTVHHDQPVDPTAAVHALSPEAYVVVGYGQPSSPYRAGDHFLVDGALPAADSHWVLAWNAAGPAKLSILSDGGTGNGMPFGTSGYNATYVGCLPDPS